MEESAKSRARREAEGFFDKYCRGKGIDIGSGPDPLTPACRAWDLSDGDAQKMEGVADEAFDFVYSSHCLEHVRDPLEALLNWWRILKPGGYLIVVVPHEDLYEQGLYPGVFNPDHKTTFAISKQRSWSPVHYNLTDLVRHLPRHDVIYMRVIDQNYNYAKIGGSTDQTSGDAEAAIEMVVWKADWELPLRTTLQNLVSCPKCERVELSLRGVLQGGGLQALCRACGTIVVLK